jgi:hypothetical protein
MFVPQGCSAVSAVAIVQVHKGRADGTETDRLEVEGPEMAIVGESAAKRVCGRLTEGGCGGMVDSLCGSDA